MQYTIRPYDPGDVAAVAQCLVSGAAIDKTLLSVTETQWRSFIARAFNRNARDFIVVEDTAAERDGTIVAVLISTLLTRGKEQVRSFRIIVHPEHRRQGIATRLMAIVETQDVDHDTTLRAELPGDWTVGLGLMKRDGFEVVDHDFFMRADGNVQSEAVVPDGFELRPYRGDEADDAAWTRLNREAYGGTIGYMELTSAEIKSMPQEPLFSLWMATRDGEVVGLCHTSEFAQQGWVNSVVVTQTCRTSGLGRALIARGIEFLRAARPEGRPDETWLNVRAENERAVALYSSMGFVRDKESYEWWKRRSRDQNA